MSLQVNSLQERLTQLQVLDVFLQLNFILCIFGEQNFTIFFPNCQGTMLSVMDKYESLERLEELHLRNLGMASVLILLPFCPGVRVLSLKYS